MEKKKNLLVILLVFLLGVSVGVNIFLLQSNSSIFKSKENAFVGTYFTYSWNGHSANLILREDGTCNYPQVGTGTWYVNDDNETITIVLGESDKHTANKTEYGLLLHDAYFEKLYSY